jgi:hypothetical protein
MPNAASIAPKSSSTRHAFTLTTRSQPRPPFHATTAHRIAPAPASSTNGDGTHVMIAHASAAPPIENAAIRRMVRRVTLKNLVVARVVAGSEDTTLSSP